MKLYTPKEVAKITGLSYQQVVLRLQKGIIKGEKYGWSWLIKKKDIPNANN